MMVFQNESEIYIGVDVSIMDYYGVVGEKLRCGPDDGSTGVKQLFGLVADVYVDAEVVSGGKKTDYLSMEVVYIDYYFGDADPDHVFNDMLQHGFTTYGYESLGVVVGPWFQTGTYSGGKDKSDHGLNSLIMSCSR